jgi:thiamine-phosphate pyrophosphorylase
MAGGIDIVQIRERGLHAREHADFISECLTLARGSACRVIVNDRLDLALIAGADGVHLRENSVPIEAARRLAPADFLIGRSVHDRSTAVAARSADYLIVGNVFETDSKPGRLSLGLSAFREIVDTAAGCPVWAVGGVTRDRIRDVKASGASGIAAIGAFLPPSNAADVGRHVREQTEAMRAWLNDR